MRTTILLAGLAAAVLAGCDNEPDAPALPEVSDANCQIEKIKKIEDKAAREAFAGLCSRRSPPSGGIAPTGKPMNWLELADPKDQKEVKP